MNFRSDRHSVLVCEHISSSGSFEFFRTSRDHLRSSRSSLNTSLSCSKIWIKDVRRSSWSENVIKLIFRNLEKDSRQRRRMRDYLGRLWATCHAEVAIVPQIGSLAATALQRWEIRSRYETWVRQRLTELILPAKLVKADGFVAASLQLIDELFDSILDLGLLLRLFVDRGRIRNGRGDLGRSQHRVVTFLLLLLHVILC